MIPGSFNRYIEPFLGSGALFFYLQPSTALLSDINEDLINAYIAIRESPNEVRKKLVAHNKSHSEAHYYATRSSAPTDSITRAARFIYLNRTCWNGLYRVNKSGQFNVPIGSKSNVILESDNFPLMADILKRTDLRVGDFEKIIDEADENDLIFADPPYTVAHNNNGFIKYNENLFSWNDQVRLRDAIVRATNRGAKAVITNAAHESILALYSDFHYQVISRSGVIAASTTARGVFQEVIIQCP